MSTSTSTMESAISIICTHNNTTFFPLKVSWLMNQQINVRKVKMFTDQYVTATAHNNTKINLRLQQYGCCDALRVEYTIIYWHTSKQKASKLQKPISLSPIEICSWWTYSIIKIFPTLLLGFRTAEVSPSRIKEDSLKKWCRYTFENPNTPASREGWIDGNSLSRLRATRRRRIIIHSSLRGMSSRARWCVLFHNQRERRNIWLKVHLQLQEDQTLPCNTLLAWIPLKI